ncbi:hypothetical protein NP233_g7513 [Leucocoprinus birnbaumii]|uniref:Acid phosphatase n=1 Tax=Leucocoprinus birnbaumii TaxID=56174 RepID=A0AAD5YUJ4_9AGAR|nr:hypothetical protein NP233_g7513 [Leucocoprinus birnbaumii]
MVALQPLLCEHPATENPRHVEHDNNNWDVENSPIFDKTGSSDNHPFDISSFSTRKPRISERPSAARRLVLLIPVLVPFLYHRGLMNCGENNQLSRSPLDTPKDTDYYDAGAPFAPYETQKLWAAYSPYYSVQEYKPPPEGCHLTQVNILQRHGARYPTLGQSARIATALMRLQEAVLYTDAHFEFIKNYEYDLNTDDLLPFGEHQMSESGRKSFVRYASLANEHNIPFVRASGSDRVIQSTAKWIDGFRNGSGGILDPPLALIIPEIKGYNNTLDDKSCPNADHPDAPMDTWQNIYAKPIADRFNSIARGTSDADVLSHHAS